jgi:hypothetical protein
MPTGRAHLCPHHCPKPSGEGGALVLVVVAVVVLALLGAAAHAVAPAIGSAVREVVEVLKIAGLTVAGAGVLALGGWAVHRRQLAAEETASAAARRHDEFPPAVAGLTQAAAEPRELPAASGGPLAIEAPQPWARETSGLGELPEPEPIQIRRQS